MHFLFEEFSNMVRSLIYKSADETTGARNLKLWAYILNTKALSHQIFNSQVNLWITEFPTDSFRRALRPACLLIEWIAPLLPLIQKIAVFLPFSKKNEKGCLFTIFVYILNVSYTFKFKSTFGSQKYSLKSIKSALFLFSAPCLFWARGQLWN